MPKFKGERKTGLKHRFAVKMLGNVPDIILPEGWIGVNHVSGAVVYLHRETRVVTWSRPYSISRETSLKKHNIPLMSIPCLHQKLALEEYLCKKDGKRAFPDDNEGSAKFRKIDTDISENNIDESGGNTSNSTVDMNVTNVPFPNCNVIEHSEIIETISSCTDMDGLSEGSEESKIDNLSNSSDTTSMADINNTDKAISMNDSCPILESLNSIPSSNETSAFLETGSDVQKSMECIETISSMDVDSQEMCNGIEESQESTESQMCNRIENSQESDVTLCCKRSKESQETCNDTVANGIEVSQETNVTSCPYKFMESQEACDLTSEETCNEIEPSGETCNNICVDGITTSQETGNCPDGVEESPVEGFGTFCSNGVEETNDSIPSSNGIGSSTEIDLLPDDGSDDSAESADPNLITPSRMHKYIGNIFEFDILTGDQGNLPIFHENQEQPEFVEDINIEKKFITSGKTPFQILNEYCQKELKALPSSSKIERHSQHDFTVEISIKNLKFGIATGDTLREAKHNAAGTTLNIFDYTILNEEEPSSYLTVFDKIPSDDNAVLPTIEEFAAMGMKYPYEILVHLLDRNFSPDFNESEIEFKIENIDGRLKKYQMKYKEYKAEGECENWKQVKQIAAQTLILVLYPDLKNWGSVIRLIECYRDLVTSRELDTETKLLKPGKCIMHVLRQEMRKIAGN